MLKCERAYTDLVFRATGKYAAWDPEVPIKVGDYGRITRGRHGLAFWRRNRNGKFVREGNIYTDGKADEFGISAPGINMELSFSAGGVHPPLVQLKAGAAFKCTSNRSAILVMKNTTITAIEHPGTLRRLLADSNMRDMVVVSEVHSCSSYSRLLTTDGGTITLGLDVEPPDFRIATAAVDPRWQIRHGGAQIFKSQVNRKEERTCYPLFRLTSLSEGQISTRIES
ncbi:hypothetical protein C8R45DRAFT_1057037 [Mycena sanguinolenta]|nr:hypothetical protein C8R45DRAFT_1057037 [Mycena sanguinolenta]